MLTYIFLILHFLKTRFRRLITIAKESAKKFIEDSNHDSNLKKEFENLLASFGSNMSLQDKKSKTAKFMTKHGYDVIASDLKDDIFSKAHDSSHSHELSLDELDNVAGGRVIIL